MTLTPCANLNGYEAPGPLGTGGMNEVYRACDPVLKPEAANTVLPPYASQAPDPLRRSGRETQAAAALRHPNILNADGSGTFEGGKYFVAELLEGEVPKTYARRHKPRDEDLCRDDGLENERRQR